MRDPVCIGDTLFGNPTPVREVFMQPFVHQKENIHNAFWDSKRKHESTCNCRNKPVETFRLVEFNAYQVLIRSLCSVNIKPESIANGGH